MTRIPDVIGEVVAYRAFEVVGTELLPRLRSVSAPASLGLPAQIWPVRSWFVARCPKGHTDEIPVEDCGCGIYAARDLDHLLDLNYGAYGADERPKVVGEVGLVGKVIPGSQGYRAERARVRQLWVPPESWRLAKTLGGAYGVPVGVMAVHPRVVDAARDRVQGR